MKYIFFLIFSTLISCTCYSQVFVGDSGLIVDGGGGRFSHYFGELITVVDTITDMNGIIIGRNGTSPSSNGDGGTGLGILRARGNTCSPSPVEANDEIGTISFKGYYGGGINNGWGNNRGHITCIVDGQRTPGQQVGARLNFWTATSNGLETLRMVTMGSGNVGIGNFEDQFHPNPIYKLEVFAPAGNGFAGTETGNDVDGFRFAFQKKRGASTVQIGDRIGLFQAKAWNGTSYYNAAFINFAVAGTPTSNSVPGMIQFSTSPSGTSSPIERIRINSTGDMVISGGYLYIKDSITPFHYWKGKMTSGNLIWTDTGSTLIP